jgi:hypothetical protein
MPPRCHTHLVVFEFLDPAVEVDGGAEWDPPDRVVGPRAAKKGGTGRLGCRRPPRGVVIVVVGKLGRDSPIVKHYSSTKNLCFVTCV